jgi:hypothetical protein
MDWFLWIIADYILGVTLVLRFLRFSKDEDK